MTKQNYESPLVETLSLVTEQMIAVSGLDGTGTEDLTLGEGFNF